MRKVPVLIALCLLVPEGIAAARGTQPLLARPCRGDVLYVDVPLHEDVWWDTSLFAVLEDLLETDANATGFPWFCGPGDLLCPTSPVSVEVKSLLPQRTGVPFRGDGHLRFLRVRFRDAQEVPLIVRKAASCDAVDRLRDHVSAATGLGSSEFFVGRECDASAMSAEDTPTEEMSTWHVLRMGLPASAIDIVPPAPALQTVDLALIDAGTAPGVAAGIGQSSSNDFIYEVDQHVHGSGMAVLTRHVAPAARLRSIRVLGRGGHGTSESVALGIDDALYATGTAPLIVNLSLGWPNELGRASVVSSPSPACTSWEDPFGEPVRYLLDIARQLDDAGMRRVFVSSAAGNQPFAAPPGLFPDPPSGWTPYTCGPPPLAGTAWFYPAHWSRVDSCGSSPRRVAFGAGIVDIRDLVPGLTIPDSEPPLVAPGQHVFAVLSGSTPPPAPPSNPQCEDGFTEPSWPAVTLPKAFSGTSVGSAFVAAAAARAQALLMSRHQSPLRWNTLARTLYVTARPLCRTTPSGTGVRRLDVARLDAVLRSRRWPQLLACLESAQSQEAIPASLIQTCKTQLAGVGIGQIMQGGGHTELCQPPFEPVDWPPGYVSPVCATVSGPTQFSSAAACGSACPFSAGDGETLVGSFGPQPGNDGCPICPLFPDAPANSWRLIAELETDFREGTVLAEPYLVFQGPVGSVDETSYVDLLQVTQASQWKVGAYLDIEGTLDGVPAYDWTKTKAMLHLTIIEPGAEPVKNTSVLDVKP